MRLRRLSILTVLCAIAIMCVSNMAFANGDIPDAIEAVGATVAEVFGSTASVGPTWVYGDVVTKQLTLAYAPVALEQSLTIFGEEFVGSIDLMYDPLIILGQSVEFNVGVAGVARRDNGYMSLGIGFVDDTISSKNVAVTASFGLAW